MDEFTASNGFEVIVRKTGTELMVKEPGGFAVLHLSAGKTTALREFFRAEEDERLGRWRSVASPEWTAVVQSVSGQVLFRHEAGEREFSVASRSERLGRWTQELRDVAFEYFDAHPEPKPWSDAAEGDLWLLRLADAENELPYIVVRDTDGETDMGPRFFRCPPENPPRFIPGNFARDFTAGRRIYPEVTP